MVVVVPVMDSHLPSRADSRQQQGTLMEGSMIISRLFLRTLATACAAAIVAGCTTERLTDAGSSHRAIVASTNAELCGSGAEVDPHPEAPGIFLCSALTANYCFNGANSDQDQDGLADYCEKQISFAFRPELRYSTSQDDIRGEPYWVARQDSAGHVIVGYLQSYYRDFGSVQWGCTVPAKWNKKYGCHNGDSESIWLVIGYNAATSHWVLQTAYYSAHDEFIESAYDAPGGYAAVQYPEPAGGGYPRAWVAEKKHANYFSQAGCNFGNFQWGVAWDWCADDDASMRLAWSNDWNIGSESHPFVNSVASRDPSYEYYGGGRTECYWTEKSFRGWVPDAIGGFEVSSYLGKLVHFGFATTGIATCDSPPPPPPAPLSTSISAASPDYTASPVGGFPPYTSYWEWCGIDCDGGGGGGELAASAGGGVHPNTIVHGWQFLSTDWTVYWNQGQRWLRLTVTDSQSQQAVATYFVP